MKPLKTSEKVILWGLGVVALGYMYYRYILSQYSFHFNKVIPHNITTTQIDVDLLFDVSSNVGVSFVIQGITADIYFNGTKIGTIDKTDNIVVPNDSTKTISIPLSVDLNELQANGISILSTLFGGKKSISIVGYTSLQISGLPFTVSVDIDETVNF